MNCDKELALLIYLEQKSLSSRSFNDSVFVDTVYADINRYRELMNLIMEELESKLPEMITARYVEFNPEAVRRSRCPAIKIIAETEKYYLFTNTRTEKTKTNKNTVKEFCDDGLDCGIINLYTGSYSVMV